MLMWIITRGVVLLILLMLDISFKFGILGLLHHVVTAIADKIREGCSSYIKVSESAQDRDVGLGEADSETSSKRSLLRKLFKTCCRIEGKLIQPMHTTMNPKQRFGILCFIVRSGLVYCSGGLSGKYTVLAVCQIVHCSSGLSFLTAVCLIRQRPNGGALRKCILKGPYTLTIVTTPAVPATEDSPAVPEQTTVETMKYTLNVDACQTTQEMWEAIEERVQQVLQVLYKPTNKNLRTYSNTRNKNVDTTPRYKNDNQTGQFRNQRAVNVVGARETVGGSVVQQSGYSVLTARNLVIMLRMQKAHNGLKDLRLMNKSWKLITTTWQRSMEVPNAVQETDSEPYESVQYDTDDNVVCQ
ncbi:hypothetical protein Tco_0720338 [Tanacetum coccineum]